MRNTTEQRPRHYAAEIVALPTREARAAALDAVPDTLRKTVRSLVQDHFIKRHYQKGRAA